MFEAINEMFVTHPAWFIVLVIVVIVGAILLLGALTKFLEARGYWKERCKLTLLRMVDDQNRQSERHERLLEKNLPIEERSSNKKFRVDERKISNNLDSEDSEGSLMLDEEDLDRRSKR